MALPGTAAELALVIDRGHVGRSAEINGTWQRCDGIDFQLGVSKVGKLGDPPIVLDLALGRHGEIQAGNGSIPFVVHSSAGTSFRSTTLAPCSGECVIVATIGEPVGTHVHGVYYMAPITFADG
jgi:hypothetical protein